MKKETLGNSSSNMECSNVFLSTYANTSIALPVNYLQPCNLNSNSDKEETMGINKIKKQPLYKHDQEKRIYNEVYSVTNVYYNNFRKKEENSCSSTDHYYCNGFGTCQLYEKGSYCNDWDREIVSVYILPALSVLFIIVFLLLLFRICNNSNSGKKDKYRRRKVRYSYTIDEKNILSNRTLRITDSVYHDY